MLLIKYKGLFFVPVYATIQAFKEEETGIHNVHLLFEDTHLNSITYIIKTSDENTYNNLIMEVSVLQALFNIPYDNSDIQTIAKFDCESFMSSLLGVYTTIEISTINCGTVGTSARPEECIKVYNNVIFVQEVIPVNSKSNNLALSFHLVYTDKEIFSIQLDEDLVCSFNNIVNSRGVSSVFETNGEDLTVEYLLKVIQEKDNINNYFKQYAHNTRHKCNCLDLISFFFDYLVLSDTEEILVYAYKTTVIHTINKRNTI